MLMNRILQPRAAASFVASCSVTSDPTDQSNELTTSVSLDVSGIAGVQGVIVEVTASTLVFNLEIDDDGWATGIITPLGPDAQFGVPERPGCLPMRPPESQRFPRYRPPFVSAGVDTTGNRMCEGLAAS